MSNIYRSGFNQPMFGNAMEMQNYDYPAPGNFGASAFSSPFYAAPEPAPIMQSQPDMMLAGMKQMLADAFNQFQQTAAAFQEFIQFSGTDPEIETQGILADSPEEQLLQAKPASAESDVEAESDTQTHPVDESEEEQDTPAEEKADDDKPVGEAEDTDTEAEDDEEEN